MVLVSVQVVQGDAKWGPHFKFTLFKFLWAFVDDCIFIIMITYYLVENLIWFAKRDCDYWYVLAHLDYQSEGKNTHQNDKT